MARSESHPRPAAHEVFKQPPPLEGYNLSDHDVALRKALHREAAAWARGRCLALGEIAGGEAIAWGFKANVNAPVPSTETRHSPRRSSLLGSRGTTARPRAPYPEASIAGASQRAPGLLPHGGYDQTRSPGFGGSSGPPAKHWAIAIHCWAVLPATLRLTSAIFRPWVTT